MIPFYLSRTICGLVILLTSLNLRSYSAIIAEDGTIRLKRNVKSKSCLEVLSECRKNTSCLASYRTVKKKCTSEGNVCHANPKFLTQCAVEVEFLKTTAFKDGCSCVNINYSDVKKVMKCTDVHNIIFANPCYDHGQDALEQQRQLGAVTMRAAVVEAENVTTSHGDPKSMDLSHEKAGDHVKHTSIDDVHENDVSTQSDLELTTEEANNKQKVEPAYKLTEEEYKRLDELFAMDYERPSDVRQSKMKSSNLRINDVSNTVDDDNTLANTTNDEDKDLSSVNDSEMNSGKHGHAPVQTNNYYDDNNSEGKLTIFAMSDETPSGEMSEKVHKVYLIDTTGILEETSFSTQLMHFGAEASINGEKPFQRLSTLHIVLVVIGSVLLLFAVLGAFLLNRKITRNNYIPGKFFKKSCQSAIIVKVVYEDDDVKIKKKIDHV